jgi:hypothetical protein
MSDFSYQPRSSFTAMVVMFIVAALMLGGCITIFFNSYQTAKRDAEVRAQTPPPPTPGKEEEKEKADHKEATFGDGFAIARGDPWFWWTLCNAIVLAALGLLYALRKPSIAQGDDRVQEDRLWGKLGLFAICSVIAFFTVACLAIPYTWIKSGDILSRAGWKGIEPWLVILAYVAGLGGMFASLLAVKSEERSNVNIRRWIYGYNAFLGGLLFLAIVAVVNAWFALYGPEVSDWTSTNIYSLSPTTKRIVKSMDKPVRAYLMLPVGSPIQEDMLNLFRNCRPLTDQFEIVELSPRRDFREVEKLASKYNLLPDESGAPRGISAI